MTEDVANAISCYCNRSAIDQKTATMLIIVAVLVIFGFLRTNVGISGIL